MAPLKLPSLDFTEMDYLNFSTQSPHHHRHHNHSHHKDRLDRERAHIALSSVMELVSSKVVPENSVLPDLEPLATHLDRMNGSFGFNRSEFEEEFLYRHSGAMTALYCVAYLLVFVVGLVGNFFVIAVVYRSPRMRTVTNFFIVNLAVADILVICFCLPATLMSNIFVLTIYSYAAIPWVIILPISAAYFGRKLPFVFVTVVFVVGTITFYTSHTTTQLLIGEAIESIMGSTLLTISTMVMTEYVSSEYRGLFLTFKSASFVWGIWVSNAIGTFFHWRIIGLVKVILSIYPVIAVFFWPESPLWLASKGQYNKCADAHRWLKGSSNKSEQELQRLLSDQRQETTIQKFSLKLLKQKQFYKGILLGLCSLSAYTFSGKFACGFYSIVIIKKMTSSESTAYTGMLILDGVTVLAMYIGTILTKFLKRRTLYFCTSFIGIASLFILSLHVYLVSSNVLSESMYISIGLLSVYSLSIGCGPALLSSSLFAEVLPITSRSLAMFFISVPHLAFVGVVTQLTPIVMRKFGLHIAFLCFGVSSTILITLLYIYLPETKDKTLHEIEDFIKGTAKNGKKEEERRLNYNN